MRTNKGDVAVFPVAIVETCSSLHCQGSCYMPPPGQSYRSVTNFIHHVDFVKYVISITSKLQ